MKFIIILVSVILYAKILVVNSYSPQSQISMPQLNGFLIVMYAHGYKPNDFKLVFLNARVNSTKKIKKIASKYLNKIKNYDYIVTFDDSAFKNIGIPASKIKKVYFSGVNYPIKFYKKNFKANWNNICGIYEKLYFKEVLNSYKNFFRPKKILLFYSKGMGEILKIQYENELKNTIYLKNTKFIYIKTKKDLIQQTKNANKYDIFLPFALSITENNKKIPFSNFKNIYLQNIKKPDLSPNLNLLNAGFLGLGGVDFYKMGSQLAQMVIQNRCDIENAKNFLLFINAKRAIQINFKIPEEFLKNRVKVIKW